MKAIKEKQLENQYNIKQKETENAISNIKKAAAREVQIRRSNLKKLIEEMRKKQKRKTSSLSQQLQSVRYQMAEQMGKAYKKGKLENCVQIGTGKGSPDKILMRKHYCTANFAEDFVNYQTCLDGDDFCHQCCDNEFGEFYIGDRNGCYAQSCIDPTPTPTPDPNKDDKNNGRWIWQSEIVG
jgi:exonuclease VII large subunit